MTGWMYSEMYAAIDWQKNVCFNSRLILQLSVYTAKMMTRVGVALLYHIVERFLVKTVKNCWIAASVGLHELFVHCVRWLQPNTTCQLQHACYHLKQAKTRVHSPEPKIYLDVMFMFIQPYSVNIRVSPVRKLVSPVSLLRLTPDVKKLTLFVFVRRCCRFHKKFRIFLKSVPQRRKIAVIQHCAVVVQHFQFFYNVYVAAALKAN